MKPLLIIILLSFAIAACQKNDNTQKATSVNRFIDKPVRKIDSSSYYSATGDTAFYAGLICDSFRMYNYAPGNTYLFFDTVLVIRYTPDSVHIINPVPHLLWSLDFFQINSGNFYNGNGNGISSFIFSGTDSLSFTALHQNPCGNPMDDYNFAFNGKRYK